MSQKKTVLVVDDEETILRNTQKLFGKDYTLLMAHSAEEALSILGRKPVSVIISDYKMTGQDGLSFLIEAKELYPHTIRALMTAYADMNLVVRAMNEGEIHRFISKPFKYFEFRSILDECLRLSGLAPERDPSSVDGPLVLIGHDSQITLSTLRIILSADYQILSTSNGLDILGIVSEKPVAALVVGVGLEMLDGCTISSYLKKGKGASFPVIFWTKDISEPFQDYLKECGADAYVDESHPDASNQLREYLKKHIS